VDVEVEAGAVLDLDAAALAVVQLMAVMTQEPAKSAGKVGSKAGQVEVHGGLRLRVGAAVVGVAALDAGALVFGFGAGAFAVADGGAQGEGGA
jgi:hypothetical protein